MNAKMAGVPIDFVNGPVSDEEIDRRHDALREAMAKEGLDAIVVSSIGNEYGGQVRYLIDLPVGGAGMTAILPVDDGPTVIAHGAADDIELPRDHRGSMRRTVRLLRSPYFRVADYTAAEPGRLAVKALEGRRRIGLVGRGWMPNALVEQLQAGLPHATFVDASDLVDRIKAIKSPEEQAIARRSAQIQDEAMEAAFAAIKPGALASDVSAAAQRVCFDHGAEAGVVLVGSGPVGGGWSLSQRHVQHRRLSEGDMVAILVEMESPGGIYTELGRSAVLGEVPEQVEHEYGLALEAKRFTLERLVPGAKASDVWDEYNRFLTDIERPVEQRVHTHGQGVDMVERPIIRHDENMTIEVGMNLTCHPTWVHQGIFTWTCDNYIIGSDGPGTSLHAFPQGVRALG